MSSAFVPTSSMPDWLESFAAHQPVTPVIETARGLLAETGVATTTAAAAVAWCVGGTIAFATLATWGFGRRRG